MPNDKENPTNSKSTKPVPTKKAIGAGWDALDKKHTAPRPWNIGLRGSLGREDKKESQSSYQLIPLSKIHTDPHQPRRVFNQVTISSLAQSISDPDVGLIEPIVVRPISPPGHYQLIAGERRFRACQSLKHETIKSVILDVTDIQAYKISIIENLNRENLNPIEKAVAFKELLNKNIFKNQTEMATELCVTRTSLVKSLRLLERLSAEAIGTYFTHADYITEGHLHAVMRAPHTDQKAIIKKVKAENWSVQQLRDYVTSTYFSTTRSNTVGIKEKRHNWFDLEIHVRPKITKSEIQELLKTLKGTIDKLKKLEKEKEEQSS